MDIVQARVDERLIHGQILNAWCAELKPSCLIILDNELHKNMFMANVFRALAPMWLETVVMTVEMAARYIQENAHKEGRLFLLSRTPIEYAKLIRKGVAVSTVTFAGRMYYSNKIQIPRDNKNAIEALVGAGVTVIAQELPDDTPVSISI